MREMSDFEFIKEFLRCKLQRNKKIMDLPLVLDESTYNDLSLAYIKNGRGVLPNYILYDEIFNIKK